MKKISLLMIIVILLFCLISCTNSGDTLLNNFVLLEKNATFSQVTFILYDKETKVMYLFVKCEYGAGLTPLYNADGTLKLYEENYNDK